MSKTSRIFLRVGISAAAFLAILAVAALIVIRTDRFRAFVQQQVLTAIHQSLGATAQMDQLTFDWSQLRAHVDHLVIHGTEPPEARPFFEAQTIDLQVKLFTGWMHLIGLESLSVDRPRLNVMVLPNGQTNVPSPPTPSKPDNTSPLETVVNLAVRHFTIAGGVAQLSGRESDFSGRADNVQVVLRWNILAQRYEGDVSVNPILAAPPGGRALTLALSVPVQVEKDKIQITNAIVTTPESRVSLTATLENMKSPVTSVDWKGSFSLDEMGTFLGALPAGSVQGNLNLSGRARIVSANDYTANAQLTGSNISLLEAGRRVGNIRLSAAIDANANQITLQNARVEALGGEVDATAQIKNLSDLVTTVQIKNIDIQTFGRTFAGTRLPYSGSISATVHGTGNLKANAPGIAAQADVAIAPRSTGIPVSGKIAAAYRGSISAPALGQVLLTQVQLNLPHTDLKAHGTLGQLVDLQLNSRDLNDFPIGPSPLPVMLNGGAATVTAQIRGPLNSPLISGHAAVIRFALAQRQFDQLSADLQASAAGASVQNGRLSHGDLQAQFAGSIGLNHWTAASNASIQLTASLQNADLADALAFAGESSFPAHGTLSADANLSGTLGNPQGTADVSVLRGTIYQERFDALTSAIQFSDQLVSLPSLHVAAGAAVLDANARFTHSRDSLTTGRIEVHAASNDVSLTQFQSLQQRHPGLAGTLRLNADAAGDLRSTSAAAQSAEFSLTSITANLRAQGLRDPRENYGDITATAQTNRSTVAFHVDSNFAGSTVQVNGQTELASDYPTSARLAISALPVEKVLSVAGSSFPARGTLTANGELSGATLAGSPLPGQAANLRSNLDFRLTNGAVYGEPFNRLEGSANYMGDALAIPRLTVNSPAGSIDLSASFMHSPNDFGNGQLDLRVNSGNVDLAHVANLQMRRPGLTGNARLSAEIAGTMATRDGNREVLLTKGDANGGVSGLAIQGKSLGNATLRASTSGNTVSFDLDSDVAKSTIQGTGQVKLTPDYPVDAKLVFKNVTYSGFQGLLGSAANPTSQFDALAEGQFTVKGSARQAASMQGELQVSRLEVSTSGPNANNKNTTLAIKNQGPIVVSINRQQLRIASAKLTGPSLELSLTGTAQLDQDRSMNLAADGNLDLGLLQKFDSDIFSGGAVTLNAKVGGTLAKPNLSGRAELKNASFSMASIPNGFSGANGVVLLSGTRATIQSLTGKVGGGDTSISGFASYAGDNSSYDLQVKGTKVRTRYQGASVLTDSTLRLIGSIERGTLSGDISILQVSYSPDNDLGTMLASATAPAVPTTSAASPLLSNLRLDVRIRTAAGAVFRTALARTLEATADLRLRGNAETPGMTGRIDITRGELVFFGNQYTVDRGNISFYDTSKIEPIVTAALETKTQGVSVTLNVSGPIEDLKLSYTSDPPLRFEEIVALLATGKTPEDPTIASQQPAPPQQGVTQMGESAIVQQAVANPISNQLQRVFGVSQLRIDPSFTTGSTLPQARLTLQQQVTPDITFTYTQDLTQSNDQLIRVEWSFNPRFSAVLSREEDGLVGIDFFYKKQFR